MGKKSKDSLTDSNSEGPNEEAEKLAKETKKLKRAMKKWRF